MSATKLPKYTFWVSKALVSSLKGAKLLVWAILLLYSGSALAQVTPGDSTRSGKGNVKNRQTVKDSLPREIPVVIGKDTLPTDTLIGPLSRTAKREAHQAKRLKIKTERGLPDPKIAVRRSMLLPGLGQAYNRSWWKIPVVYAGFGTFAYLFATNHKEYKLFQSIAICKGDTTGSCDANTLYPEYAQFDINSIIAQRDQFRRLRDLNVIISVLWYTLQSIDAYVEAHLKGFNVSEDLSMRIKPSLSIDPFRRSRLYMGASFSIQLRK